MIKLLQTLFLVILLILFENCHATSLNNTEKEETLVSNYISIMSETSIKNFASEIEKSSNGIFTCSVEGRTIVIKIFIDDILTFKELSRDKIVNELEDYFAVVCVSNFIKLRYDIYHIDNNGNILTKKIFLDTIDLLNYNNKREIISLKNHPKARSVNITLSKPKGWIISEGKRPHIVQKYSPQPQGHPLSHISYMVGMKPLATFFSKKDAQDILNGEEKYGMNFREILKENIYSISQNSVVLSEKNEKIDRYPAKNIEIKFSATRHNITMNVYAVGWCILYEDTSIWLWGMALANNEEERKGYGILFDLITNSIIFPDQYTATDYE